MKRTIFCVALTLCAAMLAGCAVQAPGKTQTPISAKTELTSAQKADDTAEVATALLPSQTVEENSKTEDISGMKPETNGWLIPKPPKW